MAILDSWRLMKEELFLMSFPSFNPIVVAFILSSKIPLCELMNFDCQVLCDKFPYIPKRFLKHFHKLIHETVELNSRRSGNKEENLTKAVQSYTYSQPGVLEIRQKTGCHEKNKFTTHLDRCRSAEYNSNLEFNASYEPKPNCSQKCDTLSNEYANMSVEEIDKSYRELLLQDMETMSFDIQFERSSQVNSCILGTVSSRGTFRSESLSYVQKSKKRKISHDPQLTHPYSSFDSSNSSRQNTFCSLVPVVNSEIRETYDLEMYNDTKIKLLKSLHKDGEDSVAFESAVQRFDLSEYKYTSKRKMASNLVNLQKTVNMTNQISSLCNPNRIQKGISSETVHKRVCFEKLQEPSSAKSNSSEYFRPAPPRNRSYQTQPVPSSSGRIGKSSRKSLDKFEASSFSQGNIILTPRETHRLSYEKIPGKKGQTRLIFQ